MKLMRVTAVDYEVEDEEVIVQLAGRDEDLERRTLKVEGAVPYYYSKPQEKQSVVQHPDLRDVQYGYESYDGEELCRYDVRVPGNCGARSKVEDLTDRMTETWESDIPFYRRVSIDYGLSGYIRVPDEDRVLIDEIETEVDIESVDPIDPRMFIADIEVVNVDNVSFEEMRDNHSQPITHITVWDSQEDEYVCLHLDRDERVDGKEVKSLLESESDDVSGFDEVGKSIRLRQYDSEIDLLNGFISMYEKRKPDLSSGWNFVHFDWDYLLGRIGEFDDLSVHRLSDIGWASGYQVERRIDCVPAFDMMDGYEKMTVPIEGRKRSYSLDYISKDELGMGKLPNIPVSKAYDKDRSRLVAYNIMDVMLCVAIDRNQGVHDFFYEVAELCQVQIYDTFSEMRLIDGYIMSRSDNDEILPTAEDKDVPENAGGLVLNPSSGVADWVSVLDLKSLYPSCMITWNLSPETIHWYDDEKPTDENHINVPWLPDADHADGGQFGIDDIDMDMMWADLEDEGLIPKYLKQLFPERAKRKKKRDEYPPDHPKHQMFDRKQSAVKVVMNAFYGVCSMDYWRLATEGLGDAITSAARYALWAGKEIAVDQGNEILYGDTDSFFVSIGDEGDEKEGCIERGEELEVIVNEDIGDYVTECGLSHGEHPLIADNLHGTDRHTLVYEFEKLYRRFFQTGRKKRYAGNIVWKEGKDLPGKMDITGFESQRSDSPEITSEVQPKVINRIIRGDGFDEVSEYIQGIVESVENRTIDSYQFALPKSLNQGLDEYGNMPGPRACRYSNEHLGKEWDEGNDPWMYYIQRTPPMKPNTDVIALGWNEDIPDGYELDVNKTLERALKKPLSDVFEEVGWTFKDLRNGEQAQSAAAVGDDWGSYDADEEQDEEETTEDEWGW